MGVSSTYFKCVNIEQSFYQNYYMYTLIHFDTWLRPTPHLLTTHLGLIKWDQNHIWAWSVGPSLLDVVSTASHMGWSVGPWALVTGTSHTTITMRLLVPTCTCSYTSSSSKRAQMEKVFATLLSNILVKFYDEC